MIRISQAGWCRRRLLLHLKGVEGLPLWEGLERAHEEGRIHEVSILEWAAQNLPGGPYVLESRQEEVVLAGGLLRGHIDALGRAESGTVLLEAKALSSRAFWEIREAGVRSAEPQYWTQVQLYLLALSEAGRGVPGAYLIARNKDTPKSRYWDHLFEWIPFDPAFAEAEVEELRKLVELAESGGDIPPPFHPDAEWRCRPAWCPYTYHCHPNWRKELPKKDELLATVVEFLQVRAARQELERREKKLGEILRAAAENGPVQVGSWTVSLAERRREAWDADFLKQALLPEDLARALKVVVSKVLQVK